MITMQRSGRKAGWALAGLALSVACWWMTDDSSLPSSQRAAAFDPGAALFAAVPEQMQSPVAATSTPLPPTAVAALRSCPGQSMTIDSGGGAPMRQCTTPTTTQRYGEILVHEVQGSGGSPAWTLRVEAVGQAAQRVLLTSASGERYGCDRDEGGCAGVMFDDDATMATRSILLNSALLRPLPPLRPKGLRAADAAPAMFSADPSAKPVHLSTRLTTRQGDMSQPPCAAPALTLVASSGKVAGFCGEAGNEQGSLPDGGTLIGFLGYEGPALRIRLDAHRQVVRVEFGPLACEGSACVGVVVDEAAADDRQALPGASFSGTTLMRAGTGGSAESVVLNGRLPKS